MEKITQEQVDLADAAYQAEKNRKSTRSFLGLVGTLVLFVVGMLLIIFLFKDMDRGSVPQVFLLFVGIFVLVFSVFVLLFLSAGIGSTLRREDFGPTREHLRQQVLDHEREIFSRRLDYILRITPF
jgi:Na+/melibiose symporter-like transporter